MNCLYEPQRNVALVRAAGRQSVNPPGEGGR